jgi:hypothetical protein
MASTYDLRRRIGSALKEAEANAAFLRGELESRFTETKRSWIRKSARRRRLERRHQNCLIAIDSASEAMRKAVSVLQRGGRDA